MDHLKGSGGSIELKRTSVSGLQTVGILCWYPEGFLFMIGPNKTKEYIGAVRIGGHIKPVEDPLSAAQREALEEARIRTTLFSSPYTYYMEHERSVPVEVECQYDGKPVLLSGGTITSPMNTLKT